MEIQIIDYGMGNLKSVRRAVEECGGIARLVNKPDDLRADIKTILPGVGSFCDGMRNLRESGFDEAIQAYVMKEHGCLLGICLGMQMLATYGEENGFSEGLNLIPGCVKKLTSSKNTMRIPHVGWNEVAHGGSCTLLSGIPSGADFYFVHSYYFAPDAVDNIAGETPFEENFCSVVNKGNVFGVQFHPEKSQRYGLQLIRNFMNI